MPASPDLPAAVTWSRIRAFLRTVETGSIREAAEALHVTPPAVSASLAALEKALGVALFTKSGRGIVATPAGVTFAGYARRLTGLLDEAAGAVRDPERGRLRIGAVATFAEYELAPLVAGFMTAHPDVDLSVSVLPRDELFGLARDHDLDLVVAGRPPRGSGLRTRARRPNRLVVVGRPGTRAEASTWLLTAVGSGTRETALGLIASLDLGVDTLTLGTQGATVAGAVAGVGVTLGHEAAVADALRTDALAVLSVPTTPLDRPWHLCTTTSPTPVTRLFVAHVSDPELAGEGAFHTRDRPPG